jgi:hypothetical protein
MALSALSLAKPELVRGRSNVLAYSAASGGVARTVTSPTLVGVYDPSGALLTSAAPPVLTVNGTRGLLITWTPDAGWALSEDYRFDLTFAVAGVTEMASLYFDLVRSSLECPVDDSVLAELEPDLPRWLAARGAADARSFIQMAWDDIVARIRSTGFRPALVTDRHAFGRACAHRALSLLTQTLIQQPQDKWDRKRELHAAEYDTAWGSLGTLKFSVDPEIPTVQRERTALPYFRI